MILEVFKLSKGASKNSVKNVVGRSQVTYLIDAGFIIDRENLFYVF